MVSPVTFDVRFSTWREDAACLDIVDDVSFFPDAEDLSAIARAKAVCATCPVASECLTWAIETNQSEGVWGGHTLQGASLDPPPLDRRSRTAS